jgi:hypothetical protein
MSWTLTLGIAEQDRGACLVWLCPRCNKPRSFRFTTSQADLSVIGLSITEPHHMADIRCSVCSFEIKVQLSDKPLVKKACELTKALINGELASKDYIEKIRAIRAGFIRELIALTDVWNCAGCGEENPITFDTCWSCALRRAP